MEIQGHRGVLSFRHGNTLSSFVEALRLGVSAIEVDLWLTSDRQLVLRHDAVVDGLDIRQGPLRDAPVEKRPETVTDVDIESRPPTLAETLALFRFAGASDVVLDIEVKVDLDSTPEYLQDLVAALATELRAHQHEQALRVRSFSRSVVQLLSILAPEVPCSALAWVNSDPALGMYSPEPAEYIRQALATGATALAPQFAMVDSAMIDAAAEAGLKVYAWYVTTADEVASAAKLGADGVCVDDVQMARDTFAANGVQLPAPRPIELPLFTTATPTSNTATQD